MKILPLLICVLFVSGCSSIPAPEKLDSTNDLTHLDSLDINVEPIPASPNMVRIEQKGQVYGAFDLEGMDDLIYLRTVARRNTELLETMVALNESLIVERNHLVELAKELERLTNVMIDELYANERSDNRQEIFQRIETLSYQIGLIGMGSLR